jgi:hypothetical protein
LFWTDWIFNLQQFKALHQQIGMNRVNPVFAGLKI